MMKCFAWNSIEANAYHFDASDESLPANSIHTFHICRAMQWPM